MMKLIVCASVIFIALTMVRCSADPGFLTPAAALVNPETPAQKPGAHWFANFPDEPATGQDSQAAQPDALETTSDLSKLPATSNRSNVPETSDLSKLAETSNLPSLPETSDLSK